MATRDKHVREIGNRSANNPFIVKKDKAVRHRFFRS